MLKKKVNELMKMSHAVRQQKFSVIKDSEAEKLLGGEGCNILKDCETYSGPAGGCRELENCINYMET
jgi:hypothetical protein